MRCLVTGASGFLGQHLVDWLLMQGCDVWTIIHDVDVRRPLYRERVIRGSIEDLTCCERALVESQADAVFHLAAQAIVPHARRNPIATLETNIRGTYNVLEAFRRHRVKGSAIVVASSDKAYGEASGCYREGDPLQGRGPYDVSKSCADLIAQSYAMEFGLPVGIVRAGNIYGPGDLDMTRIVPSVARALARKQAPVLTSDGTPVRDYLYVNDAVSAYWVLFDYVRKYGSGALAFNFSGGEAVSVRDLTMRAIRLAGEDVEPLVLGERCGEIQHQVLDSTLARIVLQWSPRVDLDSGLLATISWWRGRS